MNKDKKIQIQQKIIEDLERKLEQLNSENKTLHSEVMSADDENPQDKLQEFSEIIQSLKEEKERYRQNRKDMEKLIDMATDATNNFCSAIKKQKRKIQKMKG